MRLYHFKNIEKQKPQNYSEKNKQLAAKLHAKRYAVFEIYNPDPAKNDEVIAALIEATKLPKEWLRRFNEKLR